MSNGNPIQPNQPFPSIPDLPETTGVFGPSYGVDAKSFGRGAVRNPAIRDTARAAKAIVGTSAGTGIDFTNIQEAIDHVSSLGGGMVFIKSGTYQPNNTFFYLKNNLYL